MIFVDTTGRRRRLLGVAGFLVTLFAALYMGVVGAGVVRASDASLAVRATVSAAPTPSASVSASAAAG
ncbi:hypothetical protein [Actinoplanes awajinensis]|uniref:Uncharacterized protein n=1 Tax=Actinoplanes awajinensis subsp. mycoplanecinus TaxID=135947 RepID=A0A0X3V8Z6_9ACTN|nr:hypothetical protein [Actinoplanes awajinensis]KUL40722.1 hypothetical protein ADL15_06985 [Actinoplanes awajinensis subsp. mycoplanecinus]